MSKDKPVLGRSQCRAARALLKWSQDQLADVAGVSAPTVTNFENGLSTPMPNNLRALRQALEQAGVEFIPANGGGPGVRFRDAIDE